MTISTSLVSTSTTPMLIKTLETGKIQPEGLATHRFKFEAYETFSNAAKENALKIIIDF